MTKVHKPCFCDDCLAAYYWQPCKGCLDGHSSFWKTVIESPQWNLWREHQRKNPTRDMVEVEELGHISAGHFQEFIAFVFKNTKPYVPK